MGGGDPEMDGIAGERVNLEREDDVVKVLKNPRLPTQDEIDKHNLTHLPYRDWCPICVKAKGRDMDHKRDLGKERDLPEYSWDYCFPGDEFGHKWTVLVGRERDTKMIMATANPNHRRSRWRQ